MKIKLLTILSTYVIIFINIISNFIALIFIVITTIPLLFLKKQTTAKIVLKLQYLLVLKNFDKLEKEIIKRDKIIKDLKKGIKNGNNKR